VDRGYTRCVAKRVTEAKPELLRNRDLAGGTRFCIKGLEMSV
jgi:hypothetical protein